MRIASFETRAVRIPREPGPSAPREEADYVTLTLRTDDGIEGIAYAGFASTLVTKALKEMVDAFAGATVGADPFGTEEIGAGLLRRASGGSPAGLITRTVAAIDVALWDIKGKAVGMPVWKLLGAGSGVVPTYASGVPVASLRPRCAGHDRQRPRGSGLYGDEVPHGLGEDRSGRARTAAYDARGGG